MPQQLLLAKLAIKGCYAMALPTWLRNPNSSSGMGL
jgi:hypothetical protein